MHQSDCVISVDTSKAEVMRQAILAGADMVNDVRALQEPDALKLLRNLKMSQFVLMHMQGQPRSMQTSPQYDDLIGDINEFFKRRVSACETARD